MRIIKSFFQCLIVCCMFFGNLYFGEKVQATVKVEEFNISDNIRGKIDQYGTLTISGKGEINQNICMMINNRDDIVRIHVEDGVSVIGEYVFSYLTSLQEVILPNTLTEIEYRAFYNCTNLTSVKGNGVRVIRQNAFESCTSLKKFPEFNQVEFIDQRAFANTQITTFHVPENLYWLDANTFGDCLNSYTASSKNKSFMAYEGVLFSKDMSTLVAYPPSKKGDTYLIPWETSRIEDRAFLNNKYLKYLEIPNTVKELGYQFCENAQKLYYVSINSRTSWLPDYSFAGCKQLKFISLGNSILGFDESAIINCDNLSPDNFEDEFYFKKDRIYLDKYEAISEDEIETKLPICEGETIQLPLCLKMNDEFYELKYQIKDNNIVNFIDNGSNKGMIEGVSEGTTTIEVMYGSKTSLINITVNPTPKSIVDKPYYRVKINEPCNLSSVKDTYSAYGYSHLSGEGELNLLKINGDCCVVVSEPGIYDLTLYYDGYTTSCSIVAGTQIRSFTFDKDIVYINKGKTKQLKVNKEPFNANEIIKFYTYDPDIVTVDSKGNVKAIKGGKATVVAQTSSGLSITCDVIVPYTIKYHLNGGINHKDNPTTYWNEKISVKAASRVGYTFQGWYTDKTFTKRVTSFKLKDRTLYAKWEKISLSKPTDVTVKVNSKTSATVSCKKQSGVTGYQFIYSTRSDLKNAKKITCKSPQIKLENLKKGTVYFVRVRAFKMDSTSKRVYSSYSTLKKIKVK